MDSSAAERNKEPILQVLRSVLPPSGAVLEIASGTGQHALHFAAALPALTWQPSDPDPDAVTAIRARRSGAALPNLGEPLLLDVHQLPWPVARADALVCINMIHIAPWSATDALWRGAEALLPPGAPALLYGPFRIGGLHTTPSNEAFDHSLRSRHPEWGVRDLDEVAAIAHAHGFTLTQRFAMPANNFTVEFRRQGR